MFRRTNLFYLVLTLSIAGCSSTANINCPTFDGYKTNPERDFQRYQRHAKSLKKSRHGGTSRSYSAKGKPKKVKMKNTIRIYY